MTDLKKIIFVIENITLKVGRTISWLILFMTLTAFSVALLRYFFNIGFVWMQESYIWMHGLVFLLGSAYTLLYDKHVRVDIFYRTFSERYKAYVNIFFSIFFFFFFFFLFTKIPSLYFLNFWFSLKNPHKLEGFHFCIFFKPLSFFFVFFFFF